MSRWLLLVGLAACSGEAVQSDEAQPVVTRAWLEGDPSQGAGRLIVQTEYDPSGQVDLPQAGGLLRLDDLEPVDGLPDHGGGAPQRDEAIRSWPPAFPG